MKQVRIIQKRNGYHVGEDLFAGINGGDFIIPMADIEFDDVRRRREKKRNDEQRNER